MFGFSRYTGARKAKLPTAIAKPQAAPSPAKPAAAATSKAVTKKKSAKPTPKRPVATAPKVRSGEPPAATVEGRAEQIARFEWGEMSKKDRSAWIDKKTYIATRRSQLVPRHGNRR